MVFMEATNMTQKDAIQPVDRFDGDFDVLPFAAHIRYGTIPHTVTSGDFQLAACVVSEDLDTYPEAHWYIEAMRERRINPGRALNEAKREINLRVAARLYARSKGWA
jgi:hypothetical protein